MKKYEVKVKEPEWHRIAVAALLDEFTKNPIYKILPR
jgi:hypothetical protein